MMHPTTQSSPPVAIDLCTDKEQGGLKRVAVSEPLVPDTYERLRKRSQPQHQEEREATTAEFYPTIPYRAYIARPQPAALLRVRQQVREDIEGHTIHMKKLGTPGTRCPPQALPHAWRLDSIQANDEMSTEDEDEWESSTYYEYEVTGADGILEDADDAEYNYTPTRGQLISQLTHDHDPWLRDNEDTTPGFGDLDVKKKVTDDECCDDSDAGCACETVNIPGDCAIIAWGGGGHIYDRFFASTNGKLFGKIEKDPFSYTYAKNLETMVR